MSAQDHEVLKQLSFSQSELARYLRSTRQAVCAGIKSVHDYLDSNRLLLLYNALRASRDGRAVIVADCLKKQFGIDTDLNTVTLTISGNPDSFPTGFKEIWVFAREPLELIIPRYVPLMRQHFGSSNKTIVYFVGSRSVGDRLAQRIKFEIESIKQDKQETARIYILLCDVVMFIPHFVIFDPIGKETKGYVKVSNGYFTEMDCRETGILVANVVTAGVRAVEGEILAPDHESGDASFEVLHEL